jgi:hypothetical protein
MTFPAREDKVAVGKRRKIERTHSLRARQPVAIREPPLFAERPFFEEHLMSGALPPPDNEEIRIKIGTDAFASQTLPSRTSRTPATTHIHNFSSRYPNQSSEEIIELSSEVEHDLNRASDQPDWLEVCGEPGLADGKQVNHRLPEPAYDKHVLRPRDEPCLATSMADVGRSDDLVSLPSPPAGSATAMPYHWSPKPVMPEPPREDFERYGHNLDPHVAIAPSLARPSPVVDSVEIDEQNWRQFLNLTPDPCEQASIAVLRSSSQHVTASTQVSPSPSPIMGTSHRPPRLRTGLEMFAMNNDHLPANKELSPLEGVRSTNEISDQSPSASLQQIQRLINLIPPPENHRQDEMHEDETMWRRFVIGSRSSDSSSTTYRTPRIVRDMNDSEMEPMPDTDSDKATIATSRAAPLNNHGPLEGTFGDHEIVSPAKKSFSTIAQASIARLDSSGDESLLSETATTMPPKPNHEVSLDPRRRFKKPLAAVAMTTAKRYNTRSRRASEQTA